MFFYITDEQELFEILFADCDVIGIALFSSHDGPTWKFRVTAWESWNIRSGEGLKPWMGEDSAPVFTFIDWILRIIVEFHVQRSRTTQNRCGFVVSVKFRLLSEQW